MSSLMATAAPARRAARSVLLPAASVAAVTSDTQPSSLALFHSPFPRPSQHRRYSAMRAPSVVRKGRPLLTPDPMAPLAFPDFVVPPIEAWEKWQSELGGLGGLTPADAREVAVQYSRVATKAGFSSPRTLDKKSNTGPHPLFCVGAALIQGGGKGAHMGLHMLLAASTLGHTPSTLILMDDFLRIGTKSSTARSRPIQDAMDRFKRIVATQNNPTAFTFAGILAKVDGKPTATVLELLDKAIQAGNHLPASPPPPLPLGSPGPPEQRGPKWYKEAFCHHARGDALLALGRTEEAAAAFAVAALELGSAASCLELAKLLPPGARDREHCLLRAAQAGYREACRVLASDWADRAAAEGLSERERVDARRMSHEWALLAGNVADTSDGPRGPGGFRRRLMDLSNSLRLT